MLDDGVLDQPRCSSGLQIFTINDLSRAAVPVALLVRAMDADKPFNSRYDAITILSIQRHYVLSIYASLSSKSVR